MCSGKPSWGIAEAHPRKQGNLGICSQGFRIPILSALGMESAYSGQLESTGSSRVSMLSCHKSNRHLPPKNQNKFMLPIVTATVFGICDMTRCMDICLPGFCAAIKIYGIPKSMFVSSPRELETGTGPMTPISQLTALTTTVMHHFSLPFSGPMNFALTTAQ